MTSMRALTVIIAILLFSFSTAADQNSSSRDRGLVIWVDDDLVLMDPQYNHFMQSLRKIAPQVDFKGYRIPNNFNGSVEAFLEDIVDRESRVGGKIKNIVIATHGDTTEENTTLLVKIGEVTSKGATGPLKLLLNGLGEKDRLADNLHIYFEACSTLCGSDDSIKERGQGLYNQLSKYGISRLSMWGAQVDLVDNRLRDPLVMRSFITAQRQRWFDHVQLVGFFGAGIWLANHYFGVDYESAYYFGSLAYGGLLTLTGLNQFRALQNSTKGVLVTVQNDSIVLNSIEVHNPIALTGPTCEDLLLK